MKKILPSLMLLGASMMIAVPHGLAQAATSSPEKAPKAAKTSVKKKPAEKAKPAEKKEEPSTDEDDKEPDITGSISVDYQCELGNKVTIFENAADDKHVALRWGKRLVRLTRVDTTTGANRFENRRQGLVWIGIPAKGILLDSKKGQQLANECKNAEQMKQKAVAAHGPGILSAPAAPATSAPSATSADPATSTVPASPAATTAPESSASPDAPAKP
jgi:hypothetical protein